MSARKKDKCKEKRHRLSRKERRELERIERIAPSTSWAIKSKQE